LYYFFSAKREAKDVFFAIRVYDEGVK
jgi:hypothetical protein